MSKLKWDLDAERELWRAICAPNSWFDAVSGTAGVTHPRSLWYFIHYAWGAEFYMREMHRRWIVEKTASGYELYGRYLSWLQNRLQRWKDLRQAGRGKRLHIAVILPRNFGKSITATRCASLWTHLDEPNMSTLLGSSTSPLAEDFLNSIALTISGKNPQSWFCWLYGNWKNPNREWTKTAFHHGYRVNTAIQEPSYDITSVDIGMTGWHHDQHWWDDPIFINKLRAGGTYMETVHAAFNSSYKAVQSDGLLALVCTRYLDDDVVGRAFLEEGVASWDGMECPNTMVFQKIRMGEGIWHVFFWQAEDELTGKATHPGIMDEEAIAREKSKNAEDFACQYQNNPGASEHAPITEAQMRDTYVEYKDLNHEYPIESASIHLDTAFKDPMTVRKGDFSVIVVVLHDARPNGQMYLDTDLLRASNEWRSDQFSDELVNVMTQLKRRGIPIKCITDEKEMGGKIGIYRQNLIATLRGAGLRVPRIYQFSRAGTIKRSRIRKAAALWAEGYMRVFLRKKPGCMCMHKQECRHWILNGTTRALLNQFLRVDVVGKDDLADATSDAFMSEVWRKPEGMVSTSREGMEIRQPGDAGLKALSRALTNEELKEMQLSYRSGEFNNGIGPEIEWLPARNPYDR